MGYSVVGLYMVMHNLDSLNRENIEKAKRVASYLGIDFHTVDIRDSFSSEVYNYFIESYRDGFTPNPCVVCNREIKFGKMVEIDE